MDFLWTKEQNDLYTNILHLVQEKLPPKQDRQTPFWTRDQWRFCGEAGLLGLSVPTRYGGKGFNALTTAHAVEAFGRGCADMGLVFSAAAHLFACTMPLAESGSEELKQTYLPALCSGKAIGANAITEKEAGSDIFAMRTTARRDGDCYVLSGTKSYISNGPVADLFVVYAYTNRAHGYLGMTGFVVERDTPGLRLGAPFHKMGLTSTPACQMTLEDCRVPVANRIGKEGQGSAIFKKSMHWERSCLFASYLGQMDRQLEQVVAYARTRRQFGHSLGKKQAVAHRVADMKARLEAARLLLYRACWRFDQGKGTALDISLAKLAISEAAIQSSLDAIHLHGSAGIDSEQGIERMLRDAIPSALFSGTSEIQRDIIASELGL
jgi:alkylation response protein AidB-like acyl-CoA dehydrogenase